MKLSTYHHIDHWFQRHPTCRSAMLFCNRVFPLVVAGSYALLVLFLLFQRDMRVIRVIGVPALVFLLVTFIRRGFDRPRPYEVYPITPIIHRNKRGHSFPSRHVASAFILSMAFLYIFPPLGCLLLCFSTLLAVIRVVGGVHHPRDVIAGAGISIVLGYLLLFL